MNKLNLPLKNTQTPTMKGQSAIEYLMTYGWMLLVVAIAGGSIFSIAEDQNGIESANGFNEQDFQIQDFGISPQKGLMLDLSNSAGEVNLNKVVVTDSNNRNITYLLDQDISERNVVNLPGIETTDGSTKLNIDIQYNSQGLENVETSGELTGSIKLNESMTEWTILNSYYFQNKDDVEEWNANGPIEVRSDWLAANCDSDDTTTQMSTNLDDRDLNYSTIKINADAAPLDSWDDEFMRMEIYNGSTWQQIGEEHYSQGGTEEVFPEVDCHDGYASEKLYTFNGSLEVSNIESMRFIHGADQNNEDESLAVDNILVMVK